MRIHVDSAIVFVVLLLSTGSAYTRVEWTSPGWYVVEDNPGGHFLSSGPFTDEATCVAARPSDEEDAIYECKLFQEEVPSVW